MKFVYIYFLQRCTYIAWHIDGGGLQKLLVHSDPFLGGIGRELCSSTYFCSPNTHQYDRPTGKPCEL